MVFYGYFTQLKSKVLHKKDVTDQRQRQSLVSCKLQCVFVAVLCVDPALTVCIGIGKLFGNPRGEGMEGV